MMCLASAAMWATTAVSICGWTPQTTAGGPFIDATTEAAVRKVVQRAVTMVSEDQPVLCRTEASGGLRWVSIAKFDRKSNIPSSDPLRDVILITKLNPAGETTGEIRMPSSGDGGAGARVRADAVDLALKDDRVSGWLRSGFGLTSSQSKDEVSLLFRSLKNTVGSYQGVTISKGRLTHIDVGR